MGMLGIVVVLDLCKSIRIHFVSYCSRIYTSGLHPRDFQHYVRDVECQ